MPQTTDARLMREARRMVRTEKLTDFLNDFRGFFRRSRMGYYSDRLIYLHRWLVNDEQQQIDDYYGIKR